MYRSSLTDDAIRKGFAELKDGAAFDALADAAMSRSTADWLVGLNFSRAYSVHNGHLCTVGRVQTPTLALIVNREKEIRDFVKQPFFEVRADFKEGFSALYVDAEGQTRIADKGVAEGIYRRLNGVKYGGVVLSKTKHRNQKPPPLFNLLNLQRAANTILGLTAEQTLAVAQALYETHKLISYPRTESQHISTDMVEGLPGVVRGLPDLYEPFKGQVLERLSEGLALSRAYVDDNKLTDHHAIIPTGKMAALDGLSAAEKGVYLLVCDKFLSVFLPPAKLADSTLYIGIEDDLFRASGVVTLDPGWKACLQSKVPAKKEVALPELKVGEIVSIEGLKVVEKETKPPSRYTDATLLAAMKAAGKLIDDETMAALMKENGLGTPATRAAIIERLIRTGYVERQKKAFKPTRKGIDLVEAVIDELKSPELTGQWEQKLKQIEEGQVDRSLFDREIEGFVKSFTPKVFQGRRVEMANLGSCPKCGSGRIVEGQKGFGCNRWKQGCDFVIWKSVAKKQLSRDQAVRLLSSGKTSVIKGFTSKKNKKFDAALKLDEGFKVVFHFEQKKHRGCRKRRAAG